MPASPRPEIACLSPCAHGSISETEASAFRRPIIDFSVNSNPLGPSPQVAEALRRIDVSRYPDPDASPLRTILSRQLGVPAEWIVAGNGSLEIIWMASLAYLRAGDSVLILGPTFGEYERAARIMGARVVTQQARSADGFQPRLGEAAHYIREQKPRLVFLCNPNNPTGVYLRRNAVEMLLESCSDSLLVVDEAYLPFVWDTDSLLDLLPGDSLLLLRSMTKDYALPSLRLGYALAGPAVADALRRVKPPWSVSGAAIAAGIASLEDREHEAESRRAVREAIQYLLGAISALGLRTYPASANFLLVEVGAGPSRSRKPEARGQILASRSPLETGDRPLASEDGAWWRAELLQRGCCVRDCASFGLPGFIRIGARPLAECRQLVEAMQEVVALA